MNRPLVLPLLITILVLLSICTIIVAYADYNNKPLPNYLKANVTINGFNLVADVPTTSDEFQKGLDVKDHLNENQGMLFVFQKPGPHPFWMNGMKFPIDIIWLNSKGIVIHIEHNLQYCI